MGGLQKKGGSLAIVRNELEWRNAKKAAAGQHAWIGVRVESGQIVRDVDGNLQSYTKSTFLMHTHTFRRFCFFSIAIKSVSASTKKMCSVVTLRR